MIRRKATAVLSLKVLKLKIPEVERQQAASEFRSRTFFIYMLESIIFYEKNSNGHNPTVFLQEKHYHFGSAFFFCKKRFE